MALSGIRTLTVAEFLPPLRAAAADIAAIASEQL
jgi:hypothetical protein